MKLNKTVKCELKMKKSELETVKAAHTILKEIALELQRCHIQWVDGTGDNFIHVDDVLEAADRVAEVYNICFVEDPEVVSNEV